MAVTVLSGAIFTHVVKSCSPPSVTMPASLFVRSPGRIATPTTSAPPAANPATAPAPIKPRRVHLRPRLSLARFSFLAILFSDLESFAMLRLLRSGFNRRLNARIHTTAANITCHGRINICVCWIWRLFKERHSRHDLS